MNYRKQKVMIFLLLMLLLCACRKEDKQNVPVRIGFSAATETFLLERWDRDLKIFTNVAKELGAEVIFTKSPGNAYDQIPQIQILEKQDIDVLVVIPQDKELLSGVIKKIMDKGISVLSYDRPIMGVPISGYISFDNREVGRLLGRALVSQVPFGDYLVVNGSIRDNNSYEVNKGVHEILYPSIQNGKIRLVNEIWLDMWSFDEAREKIEPILEQFGDIRAISAANDQLAGAAVSLLSERRLAGKVAVVGQDADLLACQRVVEGLQLMTVYKPLPNLAARAAEVAVSMARGTIPPPDRYFDNGSEKLIPFYVETPVAVFRGNMDETVIKDGFHSRADVYRNGTGQ
ncbi:MAG: substrate-binding domain-containing protein [Spirochaetales bacterium]|nr:substrate-binding domain-containing protein [Spirochaetales bacterium]